MGTGPCLRPQVVRGEWSVVGEQNRAGLVTPHRAAPPAEGLGRQEDDVVWLAAQADRRFLVNQDLDFSDARTYASGTHHGLLLVLLPQRGRTALHDRVARPFIPKRWTHGPGVW